MPLLKVQLNHPGNEKIFRIGKGYYLINNKIIREWNSDTTHYRKFIRCEGEYLLSLNAQPLKEKLLFWGEWEGNSVFKPINNGQNKPNGIHGPFHSILNRGCQNTDPYVYGNCFKYATCSQSGELLNLTPDSMILFGTTKDAGFELDTVFIVKSYEKAQSVSQNNGENYSLVYREETLDRLEETYLGPNPSKLKRLYQSKTWWDNRDYFSFVPCRIDTNEGFQKALMPIPPFAKQKVGHPYQQFDKMDHVKLWNFVVSEVLKQGFFLGIRFEEPKISNEVLKGLTINQPNSNGRCNDSSRGVTTPRGCR